MHHVIEKRGGKSRVAILWDSVTEPERVAPTLKNAENRRYAESAARGERGMSKTAAQCQEWYGAPSIEELNSRIEKGWPEGVAKLEQLATREIDPTSIRRRRIRGDQGDELDMQAVYRGDLSRAWTRTRRQSRAGAVRNVTLVCNLGDSCNVNSNTLFWRGAAVLKLADALCAAGYGVGIYGAITSQRIDTDKKVSAVQFVEIKATDAPLDLSQLAGLTAMPGWFRSRGFAGIVTACDLAGAAHDESLGRPEHDAIPGYAAMLGLTNLYIQPKVNDKEAAEAWIDSVLEQIEQPMAEAA